MMYFLKKTVIKISKSSKSIFWGTNFQKYLNLLLIGVATDWDGCWFGWLLIGVAADFSKLRFQFWLIQSNKSTEQNDWW